MRKFTSAALAALFSASVSAQTHSDARSVFAEAVEVSALSSKTVSDGMREAADLRRLAEAENAALEDMRRRLGGLEAENARRAKALEKTSARLSSDAEKLAAFSAYLDGVYLEILNSVPAGVLPKSNFPRDALKTKTLPEKLRAVLALLDALKSAAARIDVSKDGEFSTGVFVRARGKIVGDVSPLDVSANGGSK